jgi:site-specific DNA recombinase
MEKVIYYARVSTQEESQLNALKDQITELEDFVNSQQEWELEDKYVDEGKSGTTTKGRGEYNRLISDIETDKFDIIVIKDETRLNRNVLDWYQFIDKLVQNKKKLYFYIERKFYTPDDALITGIKAIMAQEYSRDLSKKINNAHRNRQTKGKVCTNSTIMGYDLINGELVINKEEAEIVKYIYEEFINGVGFRIIARNLYNKGIKSNNNTIFQPTTLKRIVANSKYKGTLTMNMIHKDFDTKKKYKLPKDQWIIHEDTVTAIVSKDMWDKANSLIETKRMNTAKGSLVGRNSGNHTLSGKIICGDCNKSFWYQKRKKSKDVWICSKYRKYGNSELGCINDVNLSDEALNKLLTDAIERYWQSREEHIENSIRVLDKILKENNENSIDELQKELEKLNNKKGKLIDSLTDDIITKEEFIVKKKEYDNKIELINEEIKSSIDKNTNLLQKKERLLLIKKHIKEDNKLVLNEEIINHFVSKIIIYHNNSIDILFSEDFPVNKINATYNNSQYVVNITYKRCGIICNKIN